jgi:hypothetical protein
MLTNAPVHTSIRSNLLATAVFMLPVIYFYFSKEFLPLALYAGVIIYSLIATLSRIRWQAEINTDEWRAVSKQFTDGFANFKKLIKFKYDKTFQHG